jgi:hypothetical protein
METNARIKKGFIQVNVTCYVFDPRLTEVEKTMDDPNVIGDFVEAQPIMYDVYVPIDDVMTPEEMVGIPKGMQTEVFSVMSAVCKFIREHTPDPTKMLMLRQQQALQAEKKLTLLDHKGETIN